MSEAPHVIEPGAALRAPAGGRLRVALADYAELTKPGIMLLILTTALGAMLFAADGWPGMRLTLVTLAGLALSAGGGAALNHLLDRDLDGAMQRTARRPIPAGRVSPRSALVFGCALMAASFLLLAAEINLLTAGLALGGALVYVLVYTLWLKRRTPQNIVIGGSAGAIPPLVGWAAVTGHVGVPALFMFAIIFYWTPPHFWSLALLAKADYARASIPMLPVVRGERETARQILLYTLLLVGVSLLPFAAGSFGWLYLACALLLGGAFLVLAVRLVRDSSSRIAARQAFLYSLLYLALMFLAIGADRVRLS
jgi:heme o synthase